MIMNFLIIMNSTVLKLKKKASKVKIGSKKETKEEAV